MKKKKILLYSDCFVYSGSENVIENLIKSKEIGCSYDIIFYYAYNKNYDKSIREKYFNYYNVKPIPIISPLGKWRYPLKFKHQFNKGKYYYFWFRYLISVIFRILGAHNAFNLYLLYTIFKKEAPAFLIINNGGYPGASSCRIAAISAKLAGISNVLFIVNNLATRVSGFFDQKLDKYVDKCIKIFITASNAARTKLIQMRGFVDNKCISIPNTLTKEIESRSLLLKGRLRDEFGLNHNTLILGSVGLLTFRKGFDVLIDAVKHILKLKGNNPTFKLIIFGEGEEKTRLQKKILDNGLDDFILLAGFRADIFKYIIDFDIFVLPSIENEDFPYVVIEAMLLGKPVVGTNVAGVPEQVQNNFNGYIVEPNNSKDLGNAILKLLNNELLRIEMGRNSRNIYLNNFSNEIVIKRYLSLFDSLD